MITVKRAYDAPSASDGYRVFVDRLWPRGLKKGALHFDEWNKEVAPSDALRRWFGHDPARWAEFSRRYGAELRGNGEHLDELLARAKGSPMTLVYAAKDTEHNHALVLKEALERRSRGARAKASPAPRAASKSRIKGQR